MKRISNNIYDYIPFPGSCIYTSRQVDTRLGRQSPASVEEFFVRADMVLFISTGNMMNGFDKISAAE